MTSDSSRAIRPGEVIGLRYIMRNRRGDVLEDRMSGESAVYLQGGGAILPALQQQLAGLFAGDRRNILLSIDAADGEPDYSFDVLIISVRAASSAELLLGYPLPVAAGCGPDCECYSEHIAGEKDSEGKNPNA